MIASRGCPFACNFCSVTQMFGRNYRTVDNDRIMEEILQSKKNLLFFYDDNFAANRKRTHDLLDRMLAANLKKLEWSCQARADITRDPELIRKMRAAGCCRVYIGFESVKPDTLDTFHKQQDLAEITRAVAEFVDLRMICGRRGGMV